MLRLLQRVEAPAGDAGRRRPLAKPLRVIFEDESLAVVFKPAGIAVQGGISSQPSLRELLVGSVAPSRNSTAEPLWRPQHVHRLDAPTSGLLVVAKTGQALRALSASFADRAVRKRYRAVVAMPTRAAATAGDGDVQEIILPLSGQQARTLWRTIRRHASSRYGEIALVDLWPHTGRTHQLRRHMAALGQPIIGDSKYWPAELPEAGGGLLLSAVELELPHPCTGDELRVEISQPSEFDSFLDSHR